MEQKNYIESFCTIQNNKIILNGVLVFETEQNGFVDFSNKAYQHFAIGYPKFFKMDNLSKLAFLGAELLLQEEKRSVVENDIALVFANRSSSLDTDIKHQGTISDTENYFPSPAVFVYTLPNICLGEISIRHQLQSENAFFIFETFNSVFMVRYADILLNTKKADKVLCGWVDYFNEEYKAFLYVVALKGNIQHQSETIENLFNN